MILPVELLTTDYAEAVDYFGYSAEATYLSTFVSSFFSDSFYFVICTAFSKVTFPPSA